MNIDLKNQLVAQLDAALNIQRVGTGDEGFVGRFISAAVGAIERATGSDSSYSKQAHTAAELSVVQSVQAVASLKGILQSVKANLEAGWLDSITQLVHADTFGDFMGMAQHLQ